MECRSGIGGDLPLGVALAEAGEISLAHRRVLFPYELPEVNSRSLETLRQPLEGQRQVTISRARAR